VFDKKYLIGILIGLLCGCSGVCHYDTREGIAEVISINENGNDYQLRVKLRPESNNVSQSWLFPPKNDVNGWIFHADRKHPKLVGAVVGSRFSVEIHLMTEGACSPVVYEIKEPILKQ
jgi:hypothetical protein